MLRDQVALVTGAGKGIGEAAALALSAAGATVIVTDIDRELAEKVARSLAVLQRRSLAIAADAGDVGDIQRMVDLTIEAFGRIDILVNNAGVTRRADIMDITEADWDRIHRVNAKGVFFCLQAVARTMIRGAVDASSTSLLSRAKGTQAHRTRLMPPAKVRSSA